VFDPFMAFEAGEDAGHYGGETVAGSGVEVRLGWLKPMIAFVGLFEGAVDAMTIEIALRLRPESVQVEVGRVEGLFSLPLAFRLTLVILAESRLPGDGEHVGGRHPSPAAGL
jgi:hypothetical protein